MEEKRIRQVLGTPGHEDESSLYPPVGQLEFDRITAMTEDKLDQAFEMRHGLTNIFKDFVRRSIYADPKNDGRRVEFKRLTLARLEGYHSAGPEIGDWYIVQDALGGDPVAALRQRFTKMLSSETKARIREIDGAAREAAVLVPSVEVTQIHASIAAILRNHKLKPLSVVEMFRLEKLPMVRYVTDKKFFDVKKALTFYLLLLEGVDTVTAGKRVGFSGGDDVAKTMLARTFSKEAKNALRQIRG